MSGAHRKPRRPRPARTMAASAGAVAALVASGWVVTNAAQGGAMQATPETAQDTGEQGPTPTRDPDPTPDPNTDSDPTPRLNSALEPTLRRAPVPDEATSTRFPRSELGARRAEFEVKSTRPARTERLPDAGSGKFLIADGRSPLTGTGAPTTYTVEVEREVPVGRGAAAGIVDQVLTDPRGWTASGTHALGRVSEMGDIRVLLATPETTDTLCAPLETAGRYSCRNGDLVVLNAWRWLNGAPAYADDLRNYRRYLISHEVGHALGNGHVECPGPGQLAPVMMQQTKGIGTCTPNPWPMP